MTVKDLKRRLKNKIKTVFIVAQVDDPQDDLYEPVELFIKKVNWIRKTVELSKDSVSDVIDISFIDEVYETREEAVADINMVGGRNYERIHN